MGRNPTVWHVWHWNGEEFDLVWHDLSITEARGLCEWRNQRAIESGTVHRYIPALDGMNPVLDE